jgi:tripartite-type tricarboxylate transporter receptor subunit TctC
MFTQRRQFLSFTVGSALMSLPGMQAHAQADTVKLLSGYPPGGTTDTIARRVAEKMRVTNGKNVVVDVKTGAAGQIAIAALKNSPPDGSALLVTPMASLAIYPHTYKKLPYDPVLDLQPVSLACTFESALGVGPRVPASVQTVQDFIKWCKESPANANCGSPSAGAPQHFMIEMMSRVAGSEIKHVPYRGSQPAIMDVVGGQLSAAAAPVGEFLQHVAAGKIRLLATSSAQRSRFSPNVPTFAEQGFQGFVFNEWFAFYLPAKTPEEIAQRMGDSIRQALATKEVIDGLANIGLVAKGSTPQELATLLRSDLDHWGPVVKSIGFSAES